MASVEMSRRRAGNGEMGGMGTMPKTVGERMKQGAGTSAARDENVMGIGAAMKQTPIPKKGMNVKTVGQRMKQG